MSDPLPPLPADLLARLTRLPELPQEARNTLLAWLAELPVSTAMPTQGAEPSPTEGPEPVESAWKTEPSPSFLARYDLLEILGAGGMGEVWRARDTLLDCDVAVKILHPSLKDHPTWRDRFQAEARLTARLQHPGVVPVHDQGVLPDGRPWYAMAVVEGPTLGRIVRARSPGETGGFSLRSLLQILLRVTETVAHAHQQGVIHRDLKPDNVRVGRHGAVLVLDWGIARRLGTAEVSAEEGVTPSSSPVASQGVGTPGYMAPEQSQGGRLGPESDVFALGVMLGEILAGQSLPHDGESLLAIQRRAVAENPGERFPDASALAGELALWLDGERRREQALLLVGEADATEARARALREEAARLRAQAPPPSGVESLSHRTQRWRIEDEAEAREGEAELAELQMVQQLGAAFTWVPDLAEAHRRLAHHYQRLHRGAEERRDERGARGYEVLLRAHDRGEHRAWLRGEGALTLLTAPSPARVVAEKYVLHGRKRVAEPFRDLGTTPLMEIPLPHGSYRLTLLAEGCTPVFYPVQVGRLQHWDGVPPGESSPLPIPLPSLGDLGENEVYVPPGWFLAGGDPLAGNAISGVRLFCPGFVMDRTPVTNAQWLEFLHGLLAEGVPEEEVLAVAPRERVAVQGPRGRLIYGWDGTRFHLEADAEGDRWEPDWPVVMVDQAAMERYARWRSGREGVRFRLPDEVEWEKAARGVDGRLFPWGDFFDPAWGCVRHSHPPQKRMAPVPVSSFPDDESPYGIRGLAGGVRDLCRPVHAVTVDDFRDFPVLRGGAWNTLPDLARSAARGWMNPLERNQNVGVRLVRSMGSSPL